MYTLSTGFVSVIKELGKEFNLSSNQLIAIGGLLGFGALVQYSIDHNYSCSFAYNEKGVNFEFNPTDRSNNS